MMRILIDTNIFLDLFLARHPFAADAATLWNAQIDGRFEGYVSAITPLNVYYVTRKLSGKDVALIAVAQIIANFQVAWVDRDSSEFYYNL